MSYLYIFNLQLVFKLKVKFYSILAAMRSGYSTSVGRISESSSLSLESAPSSRSKLMNTNVDDLPDDVLIEILCRLPCFKLVFKCKSVCKLWSNLMSELHFIGRFVLQLQSKRPETPRLIPQSALMNKMGETLVALLTSSSPKLLTPRIRTCSSIEAAVVGVSGDLVLCCESLRYTRDYSIYNPYTAQVVNLPRPCRTTRHVPVGFICDPIYKKHRGNVHGEEVISLNFEYRCKVVRILPYEGIRKHELSSEFKVDIFSFDTGEWRQSIISFPRRFSFNRINADFHFVHNGMLYWSSTWGSSNFLIGLDPFMISDTNNNIGDDDHECSYGCRFIELIAKDHANNNRADHEYKIQYLGVPQGGGCLQMCVLDCSDNTHSVLVWDLKQELITMADGAGKLCSKEYFVLHIAEEMELMTFDPTNEGLLYARLKQGGVNGVLISQINFRNRSLDKIFEVDMAISSSYSFRLIVEPLWPTPVPRLPHQLPFRVYNRLTDGLVKVWKVDNAIKSFFDLMVKKLKMDIPSYQFIMKAFSDAGKFDEVLNVVGIWMFHECIALNVDRLQEFIEGELRKDGREDELGKLIEETERFKAEAKAKNIEQVEAAKTSRSDAVSYSYWYRVF